MSARFVLIVACLAATLPAAQAQPFVISGPAGSEVFGNVTLLPNGNFVVSDWSWSSGRGAVYLYGPDGTQISALRGSTPNNQIDVGDLVGVGGITVLASGDFVVASPDWNYGEGAVTWVSGTTGLSGTVSAANSLVGGTPDAFLGVSVIALANGNYVTLASRWNNGEVAGAGAVAWGSGTTGIVGVVSSANALVGTSTSEGLRTYITALPNGNYVVASPLWDNGALADAGAVTWADGSTGVVGERSEANSLVGTSAGDRVGDLDNFSRVHALENGDFIVPSTSWSNGSAADVGAITWGDGDTGISGAVTAANSLIGTTAGDFLVVDITELGNGNVVVGLPGWDSPTAVDAGAATFVPAAGLVGPVSSTNSLIGANTRDFVGRPGLGGGAMRLSNGNYVVNSEAWDNGAVADVGAVTWGNGMTGTTGVVSAANSIVETSAMAGVSLQRANIVALTNGNYVVAQPLWDDGATTNVGIVSWRDGGAASTAALSVATGLVGTSPEDAVGSHVVALANGHVAIASPGWDAAGVMNVGAATWMSGTQATAGIVSAANSLIGTTAGDTVGLGGIVALANGSFVVSSYNWSNVGAATWQHGDVSTSATVSASNSLVGTTALDGFRQSIHELSNGDYVVVNPQWDRELGTDAGAVTWSNGDGSTVGAISLANSLVGNSGDLLGNTSDRCQTQSVPTEFCPEAIRNTGDGHYIVHSASYGTPNVGAITLVDGSGPMIGTVTAANSVIGIEPNESLGLGPRYDTARVRVIVGDIGGNRVSTLGVAPLFADGFE